MTKPSFKETFIQVSRRSLDKKRQQEGIYIISVAPLLTGLMVLAALLYVWTKGWGTLVVLSCVLILLWGRWLLQRQASKDFADMYTSRDGYLKTKDPQYLNFIDLRAQQMLRDNKALTASARAEIEGLKQWAAQQR